jgi:sugar phosphate isomerase/epimerase
MNMSRRDFLRTSPVIGLTLLYAGRASSVLARQPELNFPTRPRDRLALTSWPFRAYMESPDNPYRDRTKPGMDLVEFARMAVQKFGIHNINPLSAHFQSTSPRYVDALRERVAKAGARFVDLGVGAGKFYDPELSERKAAVEYGKKWIDIARIVGSPSVRQHIGGSRGVRPSAELAAQSLGELADYGAKKNIVVNLENDSLVSEDPFFIVNVIEKTGNPYLRALPDFGNTLQKGDPAYNYRGLELMFAHAFNMSHVKDEVMSPAGKVYRVDMARVFGIAKAKGYRGYFSMEWETETGDPFQGTRRLIKETLRYLSSATLLP